MTMKKNIIYELDMELPKLVWEVKLKSQITK